MKITHIVTIRSECGTYTEDLQCISMEEATMYAEAAREEGSTATIMEVQ